MKFDLNRLCDRSPRALTLGYFCFGMLFVFVAELVFAFALGSLAGWMPSRLAIGWAFVAASSLFLYGLVSGHRQQTEAARQELETSNQQLQVLSRVFRHNIRNDLNVIQGYTDLLTDRIDDERSQECLETIRQTTDDVVAISEKLRIIEDASPEPPTTRIDLVETVRAAANGVDDRDVTVTMATPPEAWILADRSVEYPIREVFENAVTHNSGTTCRIHAGIEANGTTTCLEVRDNGPGIPEDERAVLRAEEETPLSHASSIGLWLVKWMCETQGGTVGFETSDDGTTVRLRFESANGVASQSQSDTQVEQEAEPKRAARHRRVAETRAGREPNSLD